MALAAILQSMLPALIVGVNDSPGKPCGRVSRKVLPGFRETKRRSTAMQGSWRPNGFCGTDVVRRARSTANTRARTWPCWLAVVALVAIPSTIPAQDDDGFVSLFDGKSLEGWKPVLPNKDDDPNSIWHVAEDGVLVCTGKLNGYVRTLKEYRNYVLKLEWRYVDNAEGNSGVLVHCQTPDKVWPSCIEVQLHNPTAGTVFPLVDSKTDNESRVRDKARPVGEWNTLEISCKDGTIGIVLNGEKVGEVTGATPAQGFVALQSENAEVHFQKIRIRVDGEPAVQ
jgi:hypothetical protein